jgi:hypothetical protein
MNKDIEEPSRLLSLERGSIYLILLPQIDTDKKQIASYVMNTTQIGFNDDLLDWQFPGMP